MTHIDTAIAAAFEALGKSVPEEETRCIYQSGLLDSAEMIQLLLEIELDTGARMNFAVLMEGEINLVRLRAAIAKALVG